MSWRKDSIEKDVDFVVGTMIHADGTPRPLTMQDVDANLTEQSWAKTVELSQGLSRQLDRTNILGFGQPGPLQIGAALSSFFQTLIFLQPQTYWLKLHRKIVNIE